MILANLVRRDGDRSRRSRDGIADHAHLCVWPRRCRPWRRSPTRHLQARMPKTRCRRRIWSQRTRGLTRWAASRRRLAPSGCLPRRCHGCDHYGPSGCHRQSGVGADAAQGTNPARPFVKDRQRKGVAIGWLGSKALAFTSPRHAADADLGQIMAGPGSFGSRIATLSPRSATSTQAPPSTGSYVADTGRSSVRLHNAKRMDRVPDLPQNGELESPLPKSSCTSSTWCSDPLS
jgi:hypothetical protein